MTLLLEQTLNGLQLGIMLFLLAAGLTLVFGIMGLINLAHGSLYMIGAYFAATFAALTGSFVIGLLLALVAILVVGMGLGPAQSLYSLTIQNAVPMNRMGVATSSAHTASPCTPGRSRSRTTTS